MINRFINISLVERYIMSPIDIVSSEDFNNHKGEDFVILSTYVSYGPDIKDLKLSLSKSLIKEDYMVDFYTVHAIGYLYPSGVNNILHDNQTIKAKLVVKVDSIKQLDENLFILGLRCIDNYSYKMFYNPTKRDGFLYSKSYKTYCTELTEYVYNIKSTEIEKSDNIGGFISNINSNDIIYNLTDSGAPELKVHYCRAICPDTTKTERINIYYGSITGRVIKLGVYKSNAEFSIRTSIGTNIYIYTIAYNINTGYGFIFGQEKVKN